MSSKGRPGWILLSVLVCGAIAPAAAAEAIGEGRVTRSTGILTPKRVFMTQGSYRGDLGGLEGADAICRAEAKELGLDGEFMAWLSDGELSPATRFRTLALGPYINASGQTVAGGYADLTDGQLINEIGLSGGGERVWTGTTPSGAAGDPASHCDGWTDDSFAATGIQGDDLGTGSNWSFAAVASCDGLAHLYCFQQ